MKNIFKKLSVREKQVFLGIIVVTLLVFAPAMNNDFLRGWDDGAYLFDNQDVLTLDVKSVLHMFTSSEQGNYHPFTELSYSIEHALFGHNPIPFHITNLLLHLANTALVFFLVFFLTNNKLLSFITMYLFGVHTIHVESVVWISERKDVLYTFFFLLSLISYIQYRKQPDSKHYRNAIIFFICSCFSKGMAVSLPVALVLIDYFQKRKYDKPFFTDKIPFFLIALVFGGGAFLAQGKAVQLENVFGPMDRFLVVNYNIITYLWKMVAPLNLCGFYPYPYVSGQAIEWYFWLYPVGVALLAVIVLYSMKRTRVVAFCLGFFLVTVFLVLQIIAVGGASMADRYAYVPSIGFFLLMAYGIKYAIDYLNRNMKGLTMIFYIALGAYGLWLPYRTYDYSKVWDGNFKFYSSVLEQYPNLSMMVYNRALDLYKQKRYDEAVKDYDYALQLKPKDYMPHLMKGIIAHEHKQHREAIGYFNKVMAINDTCFDAYNNRALSYALLNINDSALADFNKALELRPDDKDAKGNRELLLNTMGAQGPSIEEFTKKIEKDPTDTKLWYERGGAYMLKKEYDKAIADFNEALRLKPDNDDALYQRGCAYDNKGMLAEGIADFTNILNRNPKNEGAFNYRGIMYGKSGKFDLAIADFEKAMAINPKGKDAYYNLGLAYHIMQQDDKACPYIRKAAELGDEQAKRAMLDFCKGK